MRDHPSRRILPRRSSNRLSSLRVVHEYVDPDTGVYYLALYSENNGDVTSLTPRLNSDGTVMADKENKK